MQNPKPFHEAVVLQLNSSPNWINQAGKRDSNTIMLDGAVLMTLASLVQSSIIPANHDAIQGAFNKKLTELNMCGPHNELFDHIAAEKARCEKEAAELKKASHQLMEFPDASVLGIDHGDLRMGEENPGRLAD